MRTRHLLPVFFLLLPLVCVDQTSYARGLSANRAWPSFWRRITTGINKKDHALLLKLMSEDFFDGGGGLTPKEWLLYIDENERNGSWRDLRRSFAGGTRVSKKWSAAGTATRVTKDNSYYFEFRADQKWYFAGVVGD
jgi:hypothetical protein